MDNILFNLADPTVTPFFLDEPGSIGDGKIIEADMQLNAMHFNFDDIESTAFIDITSVLTHEMGHIDIDMSASP